MVSSYITKAENLVTVPEEYYDDKLLSHPMKSSLLSPYN
jgi:hypothetical protein